MPLIEERRLHKYEVGEEVVVKLDAGGVYEVSDAHGVLAALPDWTIAEIVSCELSNSEPQYRIAFKWAGATYGCTAQESAIEGTA